MSLLAARQLDIDTLMTQPFPVTTLVEEGFRATRIAAGDSISAAISQAGDLRVWGSFRVRFVNSMSATIYADFDV